MFHFVNIVCYFSIVVEILSANAQRSASNETVPGPVTNLHINNDEDWNIFLNWTPPVENAASVDKYCIREVKAKTNLKEYTKNRYFNVTSALKKCVPYSFEVTSVNATGKESQPIRVDYFFVPKGVFSEEANNIMPLSWNTSAYEKACYESIRVDVCPVSYRGQCQTYPAKDKMQNPNNTLIMLLENVAPCAKYNITISASKEGNSYTFIKEIKPRALEKLRLHNISHINARTVVVSWYITPTERNRCQDKNWYLNCFSDGHNITYGKKISNGDRDGAHPRDYSLQWLQPSTNYSCILKTTNTAGQTQISDEVIFQTIGGVPGPVANLHINNDEDWNIILNWTPPDENTASVDKYCIREVKAKTNLKEYTKNRYFNVTSALKKCVPYSFEVTSVNATGKESQPIRVDYFFVPKGVFSEEANNIMPLSWNTSAYEKACYESIRVDVCPVTYRGQCQTYLAKDKMQNPNNTLTMLLENVAPCAKYNITISASKEGNSYTFIKEIKARVLEKPWLKNISEITAHEAKIIWVANNIKKNRCQQTYWHVTCLSSDWILYYINSSRLNEKSYESDVSSEDTNTYSFYNLRPLTNYNCSITTRNVAGLSECSSAVNFQTKKDVPATNNHTFDGNVTLLNHIHELAEKIEPNSRKKDGNLIYSSFMTNVQKNSTNITWVDTEINGPTITLLKHAVDQLIDSNITLIVFKGKIIPKCLGDIVIVKTKAIQTSSKHILLQIKFEKRNLFQPNNPNWTCVYWDFNISKWSERGIETKFEPEFIICLSDHLSTFSILLPDPNKSLFNERFEENYSHKVWLTRISRIGSGITICFLVLVIIVLNCGKKTGNETKKILRNMSFALLLTHTTYQIHTFLEGYSKCLNITFLKYYFGLAFLLWTVADGINMWRILLADIFNTRGYIFYRWYQIISWGVPLITTIIGLFFIDSRGECQLQFDHIYDLFFYMVPWMVILCCNVLLFTWIMLNIACNNKLGRLKDKKIDCLLALSQVFGISWCLVFPLLYFESTQLLGEYLLAAVISTQGPLIFIVRGGIVRTSKKEKGTSSRTPKKTHKCSSHPSRRSKSSIHFDPTTENQVTIRQAFLMRPNDGAGEMRYSQELLIDLKKN